MDNNNLTESDLSETFEYVMAIDKSILESQPLLPSDSGMPNSGNRLNSVSLLETINTSSINSIDITPLGLQLLNSDNSFSSDAMASLTQPVYTQTVETTLPSTAIRQNNYNTESLTQTNNYNQLVAQQSNTPCQSCQCCKLFNRSSNFNSNVSSAETLRLKFKDEICNTFLSSSSALKSLSTESSASEESLSSSSVLMSGLTQVQPFETMSFAHLPEIAEPKIRKKNSSTRIPKLISPNKKEGQRESRTPPYTIIGLANLEQRLDELLKENCYLKDWINRMEKALSVCKQKCLNHGFNPQDIENYLKVELSENNREKK